VAKVLADVLGAKSRKDGYYEGNGYLVSWAIGHLLELAQPHDYDEKYKKWRYTKWSWPEQNVNSIKMKGD